MAEVFFNLGLFFRGIAGIASGIPFVGGSLDIFFSQIGAWFYNSLGSDNIGNVIPDPDSLYWKWLAFGAWVSGKIEAIKDSLSWDSILALILTWFPFLSTMVSFFASLPDLIMATVSSWWLATSVTVGAAIEASIAFTVNVWNALAASIAAVGQQVNDFFTLMVPTLVTGLQVDDLIRSWAVSLEPFWAGWSDVKDDVVTFFTDPLQWFYDRVDEFFDRFW